MKEPRSPYRPTAPQRALLGLFTAALLGASPEPQSSSAFVAGERWRVDPPSAGTWIPRACVFTADGELVWSATSGASPEALLATSVAIPDPILERALAFDGAIGPVQVAAGPGADQLYTLHQLSVPGEVTRRTLLRRYDAEHAALGNPFLPRFEHDMDALVNAPAELAVDAGGSVLVAAMFDAARGEVQLDRLDPRSGALLSRVHLAGSAMRRLELASDGSRLAVCAGDTLWVLDTTSGVLLEVPLQASSDAVAFSHDARTLVYADAGTVHVRVDTGSGYVPAGSYDGGAGELAAAVRLSAAGETLAIAWWNSLDQAQAGLEVRALPSGTVLNSYRQKGSSALLQNYPSALEMTADGGRVLLGLWGSSDADPEILLFERGESGAVFEADLPGSPYALALDPGGQRIVGASKDAHANLFSNRGTLRLFETGERDLVLMDAPAPGRTLRFLALLSEPAPTWILAGFVSSSSLEAPAFFEGRFWLDPHRTILPLHAVDIGGNQVRAAILVPKGPAMVGLDVAAQAWIATPTGPKLSRTVVRPAVL